MSVLTKSQLEQTFTVRVYVHTEVVDQYIQNELSLGTISDPYSLSQFTEVNNSQQVWGDI